MMMLNVTGENTTVILPMSWPYQPKSPAMQLGNNKAPIKNINNHP
jgi:hypothetical protein